MNPAIHAAIIAAQKKRDQELEEEKMTRYSSEELENDWEFKIVRSNTAAFRKTDVLRSVIEEESLSGWQLLEKLDNSRLRFKRLVSARRRDAMLPQGINPYRTNLGSGASTTMIGVLVSGLLVLGLIIFGILSVSSEPFAVSTSTPVILISLVTIILGLILFSIKASRR